MRGQPVAPAKNIDEIDGLLELGQRRFDLSAEEHLPSEEGVHREDDIALRSEVFGDVPGGPPYLRGGPEHSDGTARHEDAPKGVAVVVVHRRGDYQGSLAGMADAASCAHDVDGETAPLAAEDEVLGTVAVKDSYRKVIGASRAALQVVRYNGGTLEAAWSFVPARSIAIASS